jgi:AraC family transcriptional regulator of adaptative response / DNA-3-methyladenine glycosylase II
MTRMVATRRRPGWPCSAAETGGFHGRIRRAADASRWHDWDVMIDQAVCHRACDERDLHFDGVFFVAITSTRIYCRPVCPSRRARPEHRRFFPTPAAAERAGFRACLRCRPDLAPGHSPADAVSHLAREAARRIEAGRLDVSRLPALARELQVSERHLRRALQRDFGISPQRLAVSIRLVRARALLTSSTSPIVQVALESGFRSLRRFNDAFRDRYGVTPTQVRAAGRSDSHRTSPAAI